MILVAEHFLLCAVAAFGVLAAFFRGGGGAGGLELLHEAHGGAVRVRVRESLAWTTGPA